MQLIAIFVCFVASTVLAKPSSDAFEGTCPKVDYLAGFKKEDFIGEWFEIKRYEDIFTTGGCVKAEYKIKKDEEIQFRADYSEIFNKTNTKTTLVKLKPVTVGAAKEAKFIVFLNDETKSQKLDHNILNTDYKNFAVIYDCKYNSEEKTNIQRLSILSRKNSLDDETLTSITESLDKLKISVTTLKDVQQDINKCNSATSIALATILNGIILLMLTRQF